MPRARVGEPDRHLPLDVIAVERREHLQLLELFRPAADGAVQVGELLARGNEPRRERDRMLERFLRRPELTLFAQAEAEQVLRLRQAIVETHRLPDRRQRGVEIAVAIARERELVGDIRRAVVHPQAVGVGVGRVSEALPLVEDIAQLVERADGARVDRRRRPEIEPGALELAAALVGFAAPQVGEHRVGPERDGPAVGFERAKRLLVAQRGVAAGEEHPVVAIARRRLVGERGAHGGRDQHGDNDQPPFH